MSDDGLEEDGWGEDAGSENGTIEAAPTNFCAQMIMLPGVCQGAGDQLDIFMACRHPLDLLGMASPEDGDPSDYHASTNSGSGAHHRVSGYHAIPMSCEYCQSPDITKCGDDCERPKSFFSTKRPPFCPKGGPEWDDNDFAIGKAANESYEDVIIDDDTDDAKAMDRPRWTLWDDIRGRERS
ncbi:MAG: hypothetical protein SGILL_009467, partial [Bacillariaceae sp.]